MAEARVSIRIRVSLQRDLRLLAAKRSELRNTSITMTSLIEEGIEALFQTEPDVWVAWAKEEEQRARTENEQSVPFRIRADLSRKLGVLAAQISRQSSVPITKIQLVEEAGQRIIIQAGAEFARDASQGERTPGTNLGGVCRAHERAKGKCQALPS